MGLVVKERPTLLVCPTILFNFGCHRVKKFRYSWLSITNEIRVSFVESFIRHAIFFFRF